MAITEKLPAIHPVNAIPRCMITWLHQQQTRPLQTTMKTPHQQRTSVFGKATIQTWFCILLAFSVGSWYMVFYRRLIYNTTVADRSFSILSNKDIAMGETKWTVRGKNFERTNSRVQEDRRESEYMTSHLIVNDKSRKEVHSKANNNSDETRRDLHENKREGDVLADEMVDHYKEALMKDHVARRPVSIYRNGTVIKVQAVRTATQTIVDAHEVLKEHHIGLLSLFKPVLETSEDSNNMILERYYVLSAVLWRFHVRGNQYVQADAGDDTIMVLNKTENDDVSDQPLYTIDCSNIHEVTNVSRLNTTEGNYRDVYTGDYSGRTIVLKVSKKQPFSKHLNSFSYFTTNVDILTEVFLYEHIRHPMLAEPLGYCIHEGITMSGVRFTPGIITVFDFGEKIGTFADTPWRDMLGYAVFVADFLNHAAKSPLGSLLIEDFKTKQFVLLNSHPVLIDYHGISRIEDPRCQLMNRHALGDQFIVSECKYNITCVDNQCKNYTFKYNIHTANHVFFERLLQPERYPPSFRQTLSDIGRAIVDYHIDIPELYETLNALYNRP